MRFETTGHNEIGSGKLLRLILDPEWLNALAYKFVSVTFFGIRKSGSGLPVDEQLAVHLCFEKNAGGVAENGRDLSGRVSLRRQGVDPLVVEIRVHRCLPANEKNGIVLCDF